MDRDQKAAAVKLLLSPDWRRTRHKLRRGDCYCAVGAMLKLIGVPDKAMVGGKHVMVRRGVLVHARDVLRITAREFSEIVDTNDDDDPNRGCRFAVADAVREVVPGETACWPMKEVASD